MLLEECIFSVHMSAVKQPIPVDNVVPIVLSNIVSVVIFVIFDVVLVTLDVLADDLASSWQYLAGVAVILET